MSTDNRLNENDFIVHEYTERSTKILMLNKKYYIVCFVVIYNVLIFVYILKDMRISHIARIQIQSKDFHLLKSLKDTCKNVGNEM